MLAFIIWCRRSSTRIPKPRCMTYFNLWQSSTTYMFVSAPSNNSDLFFHSPVTLHETVFAIVAEYRRYPLPHCVTLSWFTQHCSWLECCIKPHENSEQSYKQFWKQFMVTLFVTLVCSGGTCLFILNMSMTRYCWSSISNSTSTFRVEFKGHNLALNGPISLISSRHQVPQSVCTVRSVLTTITHIGKWVQVFEPLIYCDDT